MKIRILSFLLIMTLIFFTSCNDNNENNLPTIETWNLKNVSGGFSGVNLDYIEGQVIWSFNNNDNILTVDNNVMTTGPEDIYSGLETGSYSYKITDINNEKFLQIEGVENYPNGDFGTYEINKNGELTIDQGQGSEGSISDVFIYVFKK